MERIYWYYWSEDGLGERVTTKRIVLQNVARCEHCDAMLAIGSPAVQLTTMNGEVYLLHPECAKEA